MTADNYFETTGQMIRNIEQYQITRKFNACHKKRNRCNHVCHMACGRFHSWICNLKPYDKAQIATMIHGKSYAGVVVNCSNSDLI